MKSTLLDATTKHLALKFSYDANKAFIFIDTKQQKLYLIKNSKIITRYPVSTAIAGIGNQKGSFKTPLGVHKIAEKIGEHVLSGTLFKARKNTYQTVEILTNPNQESTDDNITTRILWLSGMEKGINKGGEIDTYDRYIYIHGTDEEGRLGTPASHGCIRMGNQAIIELFDAVEVNTLVCICSAS